MQVPSLLTNLFYRQPNKFEFTLITNFTKRETLPNAPRNWEGSLINWARSDKYYGMIRSFTQPMDFVLDGATILREQFYQYGIGAQVQLEIAKFNASTYNYEVFYLGDIDFTNFKDTGSIDGYIVTVNLVQGGIMKAVKAYEDVKYTIPLAGQQIVNPTPIKLNENCDYILTAYADGVEDGYPGLRIVNNDQKSTVNSVQDLDNIPAPPPDFSTENAWFFRATTDGNVKITATEILGTIIAGIVHVHYNLSIYRSDNTIAYTLLDVNVTDPTYPFGINFETVIPVLAGEKLFLYGRFFDHGEVEIAEGQLSLAYSTISPNSDVLAVEPFYLFSNLMKQMNGNVPVPCQSYLLKDWQGLKITCGDAIRPVITSDVQSGDTMNPGQEYTVVFGTVTYGFSIYPINSIIIATASYPTFTTSDDGYLQTNNAAPAIVTSFTDFFKAMNAILNVGWGTQTIGGVEYSVMEKKSYFYQNTLKAISVGEVGSFGLSVYLPYLYNSVKYGYVDQTYDQINGITEFNSQANAQFPLTVINKELDLVSPYRADSTGVELIRVNLSNSGSGNSNTSGNNDVFLIHCNDFPAGDGKYVPLVVPSFSGVDTNLYNMMISPKRNLLRHGDYLHGILDKLDGENIVFTSALKNYNLISTDITSLVVSERANISIGSLPLKLFLPYEAEILVKEPFNMLDLVDKYPTGYIAFTVNNNPYGGFIIDSNTDTDQNKPQKIKLLYTPDSQMQNNII